MPFAAPPGLPADRAKALQDGFLAAHKDPELLVEAARPGIDVRPIGHDEVRALINRIAEMPKDQLQSIETLIEGGG